MQQEQLARARHDKLLALRAYKAAEDALLEAQEELPPLKIAKWVATCTAQCLDPRDVPTWVDGNTCQREGQRSGKATHA